MLSLYKGFIKYLVSYFKKFYCLKCQVCEEKGHVNYTCKLITRYQLKIFSYYLTNCSIMK